MFRRASIALSMLVTNIWQTLTAMANGKWLGLVTPRRHYNHCGPINKISILTVGVHLVSASGRLAASPRGREFYDCGKYDDPRYLRYFWVVIGARIGSPALPSSLEW